MKKAVFYGRYSSANQTEQSIEGQLHVCEKYAATNDIEIIAQYIDRAATGTNAQRREFQRMISDSEKNMFEAVLVYKLDRFARNRFDSAMYKRKLSENGVKVISATENISDGPEGIIMEAILEGMDEYYSAELSRKMRRGLEESFRKGRYLSNIAPYGYQKENHKLVVDKTTSPIVKEIFQKYLNGTKELAIVRHLNEKGITNSVGSKWTKSDIDRLLRKTIYKGEYRYADFEGSIPCPAIIEPEVFDRVQELLEDSRRRTRENRTGYNYILTGKLHCVECGTRMSGVSVGGKYFYYTCQTQKHRVRADKLHEKVITAIGEYLVPEKITEFAEAAYKAYKEETAAQPDERPAIEKEIVSVERQIANAVKAILAGVELAELTEKLEELKKRKAELEKTLLETPTPLPEFSVDQFRAILERIIEQTPEEILRVFVNSIYVYDDKAIILINLTDETNEPPLEQILCRVSACGIFATLHKTTLIIIAA